MVKSKHLLGCSKQISSKNKLFDQTKVLFDQRLIWLLIQKKFPYDVISVSVSAIQIHDWLS